MMHFEIRLQSAVSGICSRITLLIAVVGSEIEVLVIAPHRRRSDYWRDRL